MVTEIFRLRINISGSLTDGAPKAPPSASCKTLPATHNDILLQMKIIWTILFSIISFSSVGQRFSVSPDKMNILYQDVDNPLTITVENCPCSQMIVKTDNGKIEGKNCSYYFHTDSGWKANILIYKRVKQKLVKVGQSTFRVKSIPYPVPKVGPSAGGNIKAIVLKNQQFIRADYDDFEIDIFSPIDSFTVSIIRGDTCVYNQINNRTSAFSKELVNALSAIKEGDTVIFKNIFGRRYNGEAIKLQPLIFYVTD